MKVHTFEDSFQAYNAAMCRDDIQDGDVFLCTEDKVVGFLTQAWPIAVTYERGQFHTTMDSYEEFEGGAYLASAQKALEVAQAAGYRLP